jgi:hypothetical protein
MVLTSSCENDPGIGISNGLQTDVHGIRDTSASFNYSNGVARGRVTRGERCCIADSNSKHASRAYGNHISSIILEQHQVADSQSTSRAISAI